MQLIQLVHYLRESCLVDNGDIVDSEFIALTDEQLEATLVVASSRCKVDLTDEDSLNSNLYILTLLAKKEVYYRLATKSAPLYNLESDTGKLARSDRFEHYLKLIQAIEEEYQQYQQDIKNNVDVSNTNAYNTNLANGEVFLATRYFSPRNHTYAKNPTIRLNVDNVYEDKIEISWKLKSINRFKEYTVYINKTNNIIDKYTNSIMENATKLEVFKDIHRTCCRVDNLEPSTIYHIAIVVEELNGLKGYDEVQFVTKGVI